MVRVALLQIDVLYGEPEKNYQTVKHAIENVGHRADIIVLPELWNTGYDLEHLDMIADKNAERTISFLSELARTYNVHIIGGSVAEECSDGMRNAMLIINHNGELVHKYRKLHLIRLMDEHRYLLPGSDQADFMLEDIPMAGFICYDIRFPEWIRKHALKGAKVMFVVAQWPKQRIDHWQALLKARAIENQCYVIATNRIGHDPNNEFGGMSLVIDPWGKEMAKAGISEEVVITDIDFSVVDDVRKHIPVFSDRHENMYE